MQLLLAAGQNVSLSGNAPFPLWTTGAAAAATTAPRSIKTKPFRERHWFISTASWMLSSYIPLLKEGLPGYTQPTTDSSDETSGNQK